MKSVRINFVLGVILTSSLYAQGQNYDFTYSSACNGQQTSFYSQGTADQFQWTVNGTNAGTGSAFNYTFSSTGYYDVTMVAMVTATDAQSGFDWAGSVTHQVYVSDSPDQPIIQGATSFCDAGNVSLTISNPGGNNYQWTADRGGYSAEGYTVGFDNITQTTTFTAQAINSSGCTSSSSVTIEILKTAIQPQLDPQQYYHRRIIDVPSYVANYFWQTSQFDIDESHPVNGNYTVTTAGTYYVRQKTSSCWTNPSDPVQVFFSSSDTPPLAAVGQVQKPGYTEIILSDPDRQTILTYANYYWVSDGGANPSIVSQYNEGTTLTNSRIFNSGAYYLRGKDVATSTWGPTLTLAVQCRSDDYMNWVSTTTFDGTINSGTETISSSSKSYFDELGKPLQTQALNVSSNQVLASHASIKDKYGRDAVAALTALTLRSDFRYNGLLVADANGDVFDYRDFEDNPIDTLGSRIPGTVGWYYSKNNTIEPLTPKSKIPYSRVTYYPDGIGGVAQGAGVGEKLKIGTGHESRTGTFPVFNELVDYLTLRSRIISTASTSLSGQAVQTVVRDENGKYAISIADKSGKTILTARKGSSTDQSALRITNNVTAAFDQNPMIYFYILDDQPVSLDGSRGTYSVENSTTGQSFSVPSQGNWPSGFYRLIVSSGQVQLSYTNYFTDLAYQFYDDKGRLISSVSPNGFGQRKAGSDYSLIDKTTYTYNHRGWLLSMTEPDAGTTNYKYRKDGSIRYSQNAKQATASKFSYTLYDKTNRPTESGEYTGTTYSYSDGSLNPTLEFDKQKQFDPTEVNDWIKTHYDFADKDFTSSTGLSLTAYSQTYVRNAVSWTENANNKTWYSYDELGRVVWMAQKPAGLHRTFVVEYQYDLLGNVLQVKQSVFLNDGHSNPGLLSNFFHHYEYDADKRLSKAYTSTDGTNKTLHAAYQYYLHGPLKRIELAGNLQGIDFIYNINGWLQSINHPDVTKDPGQDGVTGGPHPDFRADVFGLLLNYYDSEFTNLFPTAALDRSKDVQRFHRLPQNLVASLDGSYNEQVNEFFSSNLFERQDYFKNYSAQNALYKKLVKKLSTTEKE